MILLLRYSILCDLPSGCHQTIIFAASFASKSFLASSVHYYLGFGVVLTGAQCKCRNYVILVEEYFLAKSGVCMDTIMGRVVLYTVCDGDPHEVMVLDRSSVHDDATREISCLYL